MTVTCINPNQDDTAFVQSKLDGCGLVVFAEPATYVIRRTLVIHSNTRLVCAPGVVFIAGPRSCCSLLENEHFRSATERDHDIIVEGGLWDGNCDEMGLDPLTESAEENRIGYAYSPDVFKGKLMRFAHVDVITLEKLTVKDPVSYSIQIADTNYFITRDIHFVQNCHFGTTDGVHINGPARFGLIENISGNTNDDMVSLTSVDEAHAEVTRGPISTVEIKNVSADGGYSGVRILSCGEPVTDIHVSGVYGTYRHNAVLVSEHHVHPGEPIWLDDISIEHVHASKCSVPLQPPCHMRWEGGNDGFGCIQNLCVLLIARHLNIGNLVIRDVYRHEEADTKAPLIELQEDTRIKRLVLENVSQSCRPGINPPLIVNHADIEDFRQNL